MRILVLARHAKAEHIVDQQSDHSRPLALRGRGDAKKLGEALTAHGIEPDVAFVSDSVRTQQTWKLASQNWEDVEVAHLAELYDTTVDTLLGVLGATPAGAQNVLVVGHEPTMSAAASVLAGPGSDKAALQRVALGLSTGVAAVFELDGEWSELEASSARLRAVVGRHDSWS